MTSFKFAYCHGGLAGVACALLAMVGLAHAHTPRLSGANAASLAIPTSTANCSLQRVGETAVATTANIPTITVTANGVPLTLILDTGAERTILTAAVAERVNAQPPRIAFQRRMDGIVGSLPTHEVELRSFAAGPVVLRWRRVVVAPITIPTVSLPRFDGLLGADALNDFDIDLDLPQRRMIFYQKPTCLDAAPAWTQRYAAIDTGRSRGDHLFFPVQLDGREITGFVDTGAQTSTLSVKKARVFGLTDGVLAHDPSVTLHGATAGQLDAHVHRFSRLQVGSELIADPQLAVADFNLSDADIVLGMDFIASRRIWLSYGSRRIFLARRQLPEHSGARRLRARSPAVLH